MMDILEDYCCFRQHSYCRLDGSMKMIDRHDEVIQFTIFNCRQYGHTFYRWHLLFFKVLQSLVDENTFEANFFAKAVIMYNGGND